MVEIRRSEIIPLDSNLRFKIDNISGEINYIIIRMESTISLNVSLEENPQIVLFTSNSIIGSHYLPIRVRPINKINEGFTFGAFVKYKINDNVIVDIGGKEGVKIDFILDYTPTE